MITTAIWLIFAHVIGDIALQSDWMAQNKGKFWIVMLWHSVIWTAMVCVALEYLGLFAPWKVGWLVFGHFACDIWKCVYAEKFPSWHLYVDQLWHLFQLLIVGGIQ